MNTTTRCTAKLFLLILPAIAHGQDPPAGRDKWALGVGAAAIASPYAGEEQRVRPFPLIQYDGERVFLRGISGGVHVHDSEELTLDALVSARLDGFDIEDLGHTELLANGLDSRLLSDRDDGIDLGLRATYRPRLGAVTLEGTRDIAGASDGIEVSLDYGYSWLLGATRLTASAGASWMSADLAGYYYGTLDEEVARGVAAYSPGAALVPRFGLTAARSIGASKWQLLASAEYQLLPDELTDSPLLESGRNGTARLVLGLSRRF